MGMSKGRSIHHQLEPAPHSFEDPICSICQETVGSQPPGGVAEGWTKLPCGHWFGSICIKQWMISTVNPACPICRHNLAHQCGHPLLPHVSRKGPEATADQQKAIFTPPSRMGMLSCLKRGGGRALRLPCKYCRAQFVASPCDWLRWSLFYMATGIMLSEDDREEARDGYWEYARSLHRFTFSLWWAKQEPKTKLNLCVLPSP